MAGVEEEEEEEQQEEQQEEQEEPMVPVGQHDTLTARMWDAQLQSTAPMRVVQHVRSRLQQAEQRCQQQRDARAKQLIGSWHAHHAQESLRQRELTAQRRKVPQRTGASVP